jgi:hypothetical protein
MTQLGTSSLQYGASKIHKDGVHLIPTVNMLGYLTYSLEKNLAKLLVLPSVNANPF